MAETHGFSYAEEINSDSPMWMGFLDQQTNGAGPAHLHVRREFLGSPDHRRGGHYFDNGAIQHLSHVIEDLAQFYARPSASDTEGEPFTERCQYMFRSNPIPSVGNTDQFNDGGGPSYFPNVFQGTGDAAANAQGINTFQGEPRMGHLTAFQRSSRAADSTPIHVRMDGPGLDNMDVPEVRCSPSCSSPCSSRPPTSSSVLQLNQGVAGSGGAGRRGSG